MIMVMMMYHDDDDDADDTDDDDDDELQIPANKWLKSTSMSLRPTDVGVAKESKLHVDKHGMRWHLSVTLKESILECLETTTSALQQLCSL